MAPKAKAKAKPTKKPSKGGKAQPVSEEKKANPLFQPAPKNFGLGGDIKPKNATDLTRFTRWPLYVQKQRQLRVLQHRLKIPPSINQFRHTLDNSTKADLFKLAKQYQPESRSAAAKRRRAAAAAKATGKAAPAPKKKETLICGIQAVTRAVEQGRAKLVVIAHDVVPLEIVLWLPALCRKMKIPYCIAKGKASLGSLVGFKTATCIAFVGSLRGEHQGDFSKLVDAVNTSFLNKYDEARKHWGGGQMSKKSQLKAAKRKTARG